MFMASCRTLGKDRNRDTLKERERKREQKRKRGMTERHIERQGKT